MATSGAAAHAKALANRANPFKQYKQATSIRDAIVLMDNQYKSQFEVIITSRRPSASSVGAFSANTISTAEVIASSAFDNLIAQFFLYDLTIPLAGYGYEMDRMNSVRYTKGILYTDDVTFAFLDDSFGTARRYISMWTNEISKAYKYIDPGSNRKIYGRVFKSDQNSAKKDAVIYPLGPDGLPLYPPIKLRGLKLQSPGQANWGHALGGEAQMVEVTLSVDDVLIPTIFAI